MKPRICLAFNNCVTNDPCALCGARCDPCGLDFTMRSKRPGRILVCDACAAKHAPDLVRARDAGLTFARFEREAVERDRPPPEARAELKTLRELTGHLLAALRTMKPDVPDPRDNDLPF